VKFGTKCSCPLQQKRTGSGLGLAIAKQASSKPADEFGLNQSGERTVFFIELVVGLKECLGVKVLSVMC